MRAFRHFDWCLFLSMAALIAIGTVAIWSAGNARSEQIFHEVWKGNLLTAVFGMGLYFILAIFDYRKYLDMASIPMYVMGIVFLIAVLAFGSTVYGGKRWLWFFQPSEVSKLCVITMLAVALGSGWFPWVKGFGGLCLTGLLIGLPVMLILAEPDLGTALTLIPAGLAMTFSAGVWRKGLATLAIVGGVAALLVLGAVYEAEKPGMSAGRRERIMEYVPLKPHQVKRIRVFLFPEEDLRGAGWNLRQAKISIGTGGLRGKGIGKGELNHLKYLPPAISMNDFIFCVYAEEMGFLGSVVLLSLFGLLLVSCCRVVFVSDDARGRLMAIGVGMLIFAHVYINVAMSIGLVPITGLPLPFISSGRTFLMTIMCGLGLIQSISMHREEKTI